LLRAIDQSLGAAHINRTHQRSFSLNVFLMNTQELIEITQQVHDPDEGLRLMSQDNRDAGQQTHREISRRIHNFAVSALTLVEHTRIFMRARYASAPVLAVYEAKIKEDFADDPVSQFVQKLRNYMVHRGLPNTEMYLHMEQDPASGRGASLQTGVRIRTESLLEWKEWGDPAREYIAQSGRYLDIRKFASEYAERVSHFHNWLQNELNNHHRTDLEELRELQVELTTVDAQSPKTEVIEKIEEQIQTSIRQVTHRADSLALDLLNKIRQLKFSPKHDEQFKTQRPIAHTLTEKDIIDTPIFWGNDAQGRRVIAFITKRGEVFGLDDNAYDDIFQLAEEILVLPWATNALSRQFVEKTTITWLQTAFEQTPPGSFVSFIETEAQRVIEPLVLWVPVANFEVEDSFSFGPVTVRPISPALLDNWEADFLARQPQNEVQLRLFFEKLRNRIQGLAAIIFEKTSDPNLLREEGAEVARVTAGLLRFLSPAAQNPNLISGVAPLGSEHLPSSNLLVVGNQTFEYSEGMIGPPSSRAMLFSRSALLQIDETMASLGRLVRPEALTQFAFAVRASILLFTSGIMFSDPIDRLTYSVSAMEKLLVKHSAEPAPFSVSKRMQRVLSQMKSVEDEDPGLTVREAYRLLARRDLSPLAVHQRSAALLFSIDANLLLRFALKSIDSFENVEEFVDAIDRSQS
jgi:hypothetical protein